MDNISNRFRGIYHGWWVALSGSVSLFILNGFQSGGSMGLFFVAVERELGWSRTLISGAFSLIRLENSILAPIEGYLADRIGPHQMVFAGFIIGGIGFLLLGLIHTPWHFYVALLVITTGAGIGGLIPVLTAVNWWFKEKRTQAVGITTSAFGLAYVLGLPIAWSFSYFGWRWTSVGIGILLLVTGYPLSRLLKPPKSLEDGNDSPKEQTVSITGTEDDPEYTLMQAIRARAFWLIPLTHAATGFTTSAISIHGIPHLTDVGLSLQLAAGVMAIQGVVEVIWRVFGSILGDRVNKQYAISIYCLIQSSGAVILAYAKSFPVAVLFAILFGIGHGGRGPLLSAIRGDYFGRRNYGTIYGVGNFIMSWTGLLTPLLLGWLHDFQGTYFTGFIAMSLLTGSGSILILFAKRPTIALATSEHSEEGK